MVFFLLARPNFKKYKLQIIHFPFLKLRGFLVTPSECPIYGNLFYKKRSIKMIDTIKIYTEIDFDTYEKIHSLSIVKTAFDNSTKNIFYEIINDHLERFL